MTDLEYELQDLQYGYYFKVTCSDGVTRTYDMYDDEVTKYYVENHSEIAKAGSLINMMDVIKDKVGRGEIDPREAGFKFLY